MPNHCYNRVTVYGSGDNWDTDETRDQIAKIKEIFEGESIFTHFIPEPDWATTPNKDGELPTQPANDNQHHMPFFKSTDKTDDRWYDWRLQHWDTKWDAYDVEVTDDDPDQLEVTFNTAWSPPQAVCYAMRELYPDLSVSWFYDEPGCEIAGYV